MMRRILHSVLALAVTVSLSSCAMGNNDNNNRVGVRDNNGIGVRRLTQPNVNNATYRDGVYTGYGDNHRNGNEAATVTIRNGRIADIDLFTVNQQGGTIFRNGYGTNNLPRNGAGMGTGTRTGTGTDMGNRTGITGGRTTVPGTVGEGTTGDGYVLTPGRPIDNNTGIGTRTGAGNGITGGVDTVNDAINGARTRLVRAILRDQRYDVTIDNTDTATTSTVNNWKLAVRRALDKAR